VGSAKQFLLSLTITCTVHAQTIKGLIVFALANIHVNFIMRCTLSCDCGVGKNGCFLVPANHI